MLIGIQFSELSARSKALLIVAEVLVVGGVAVWLLAPQQQVWMLRFGLLAVLAFGGYWLSFLDDFRGRLDRGQIALASALGLLPWVLVVVLAVAYPQWLMLMLPRGGG